MKITKSIIFLGVLLAPFSLLAQETCRAEQDTTLRLLSAEMKRGFKILKKQQPSVYYLSYILKDYTQENISVANGGISQDRVFHRTNLEVFPRVGTAQMDNTRTLKNGYNDMEVKTYFVPSNVKDEKVFTTAVWYATEQAVKNAQEMYSRVQADVQISSQRRDDSADFVFPKKETFCQTQSFATFDKERIRQLLLKASELTKGKKFILSSEFEFSNNYGYYYFVDSVGTLIKEPYQLVRLSYDVNGQTKEGAEIQRSRSYDVLLEQELPSDEQILADVVSSIEELQEQLNSPDAEPVAVPGILKSRAMGVFVHEVLGHRMEGFRQKEDSFGRTFTDKIGQAIIAPFITIVDDPTLSYFNGIPLRGFYHYDNEGVKGRPAVLVENGVLKGFMMNNSPIKGFPASNGHGRSEFGYRSVARMSNTRLISSKTMPYEELEKMLLEEVKKQGKPYGVIIEDISGGFAITDTFSPQTFNLAPTRMYRLYPDGRKEVVHGLNLVGTPLSSFREIIATADDYGIFNGSCGAESGWVPVSSIAPSTLLRTIELEKSHKSPQKMPLLPPPSAEVKL